MFSLFSTKHRDWKGKHISSDLFLSRKINPNSELHRCTYTKITQTSSIILESCTVHSRIFVVGEYPMLHFSQSVFIIIDILSGISAGAKKCSKSDFTDVHRADNVTYSYELHCNRVPSFGMTADVRPSRLPKSIYTVPIRAQNLNFKNEIISIEF